MAVWLFALKLFLVYISVFNGVAATSESIKVGDILLLPTQTLQDRSASNASSAPSAPSAKIRVEPLSKSVEETTVDPAPTAVIDEEVIARDVEEVTVKVGLIGTTPEEDEYIDPDLESSLDLLNESDDAGPLTNTSAVEVSGTAEDIETIDVKDNQSEGKTHMDVNIYEPEAEEIAEFNEDGEEGMHPVAVKDALFVHREKVFEGKTCLETVAQEKGDIEMQGAPADSLCTGFAWTVEVGDGFSADVTLKALNVSEVNGEFMIIGPGSSLENLWQDESNPLFTAVIKKERKFRILEATTFTVFLVTNTPEGFEGGFSLSYERAVRVDTTPVPTTPAPTLPAPGEDVASVITVYVGGKTPKQFSNQLDKFQNVMANMATTYSQDHGIQLTEVVTSENVVVSLVTQCDVSWRDSETCVRVNMSVAVITPNSDNPDLFELTAEHLQDAWDTMAATDPGLAAAGLHVYLPPNPSGVMYLWLGISLGVLIIFMFFLLAVWRVEVIRDYARMTNKANGSLARESTMSRDSGWFPTSHQMVPPFMDVYSEVGYVEYEPEFNGPAPVSKYQTPTIVEPMPMYEPPPKYGPPIGFGGAVHFYGNTMRHFDNDAFEEDEEHESKEEEVNTSQIKYPLNGILKKVNDNDNSTC